MEKLEQQHLPNLRVSTCNAPKTIHAPTENFNNIERAAKVGAELDRHQAVGYSL